MAFEIPLKTVFKHESLLGKICLSGLIFLSGVGALVTLLIGFLLLRRMYEEITANSPDLALWAVGICCMIMVGFMFGVVALGVIGGIIGSITDDCSDMS